ncbi:uncharacterized protein LOC132394453 [Hypanus sabinus]|uniref:uncharacterized protein LOC132394453 n=1 Tax=Hypanus sabinus TaxID=79690 RepID=UPI0028C3EFED|nr:uncharacterized protein LOC132394453 [Hypanus sabinus]
MAVGSWCLQVFRSVCGLLLGSNCGSMMTLFLLPLLLLLSSVHIVFNGDTHLNVKRSAAYPRPNAAVTEEVGSSGSSMLLDPKFTFDLSKEEVVWEWQKWNSTKSLNILDHVPRRSYIKFPSEQFKRRLQFNISNGALTINPLERRDQGTYMVYIQGEKKKELHLHVYEELSDAMILANASSLGSTIQLTCNVSGDDPGYQWWFKGGEILGHHQLMDGNRTLIIPVASARDCGIFSCEATNPVSSVRANYTLAVPGFLLKTIAIVVLFIIELVVSLHHILPVLLCHWKMESGKAPKNQKCLLGLNLIDILLLVGFFITFIYWIMLEDAAFILVLVLCPMFAQLLALILPFIIPKLSCPSIECLQKFRRACNWTFYVVMVITSIVFFVISGNNPGCDSSLKIWSIFFSTRILNVVIFFLSVVAQYCRNKHRSENGSTVKGEQDIGELQELKQPAPDHPADQ